MSRIRDLASILTASSSMATDTEVSAVSAQIPVNVAGKNFVINGGMDIWQRGTTFSAPSNLSYTADRWFSFWGSSNRTVSRQTGFGGNNYSIRVGRNSGVSDTSFSGIGTIIESANMYLLQGKTVTLSFYARIGANFSGNLLATVVQSGTGIDQGAGSWWAGTWTSRVTNKEYYINPTTTATRYSTTFTIPSDATELLIYHQYAASGTAGAADYFEITGVQLEIGSVVTDFSRAGGDIQGELAKCQRYYQVPPTAIFLHGYNSSAAGFWWQPPVVMRTAPTASLATTSPYWESVPYTTIGSLTNASLNNTKMTASGGTIVIAGTYSPSPATSYPSLFNGSNITFSAEL